MLVRLVIGPSIRLLGSQRSSGRPRDGRRWRRFFEKVIGQMHPHCTAAAAHSVYTHRQTVASILRIEFETQRHLARRVSPRVYTWYSKRRPFRPRQKHTSKKTARRLKCRIYIGGYWRYQRRPGPANKIKQGHLKSHPDRKKKKNLKFTSDTQLFFYFLFCFWWGKRFCCYFRRFWLLRTCNARPVHSGRLFLHAHLSHLFFLFFYYCSAISSFDGWIRAIVPSAVFSQSI